MFEATERLVAERGAFRADQFELDGNFRAHYLHTGPELLRQAAGSGLEIDAFVDFVGSGGTWAGVAAALREAEASVRCYCVEPEGAAVIAGRDAPPLAPHAIQGGGYGMAESRPLAATPPPDGYIQVSSDEARENGAAAREPKASSVASRAAPTWRPLLTCCAAITKAVWSPASSAIRASSTCRPTYGRTNS